MKAIALVLACGLTTLVGCQVSGEAEVDTTRRPSAGAQMEVGGGGTGGGTTGSNNYSRTQRGTGGTGTSMENSR